MANAIKDPPAETVSNSANTAGATPFKGAVKLRGACAYLGGISVPTVHRLIKRGLLKPNRSTRHLLFSVAKLDRFLRDGQSS
jgi:hypothetical protein